MMKTLRGAFFFLVLLLFVFSIGEAAPGDLPDFRISDIPATQTRPGVAYGSTMDQFLVVWEDFRGQSGFGTDVYAQLVNGDGSLSGGNFPVTTANDWQRDPKPAFNPITGRYLVVWEEQRNATDDIYGQQINSNGTLFGPEFVISNGPNDQSNQDIVYSPANNQFLVVFDDDRLVAADLDIYGRLVNADGTLFGTDFPISTPGDDQLLPVVAHNTTDNQFLVVWVDQSGASDDIYGRLVNGDGSMDGPEFPISTASADQDLPDVAYDSYTNQYLVAWEHNADIYGRIVKADGSFLGGDFLIASTAGGLNDPAVQFDPNSRQFLVAWWDNEGWDNIYGRLVDTSGNLPDPIFEIAFGTGDYRYPDLALNTQTHNFLLVWRHETCYDFIGCDDNDIDIFGALYQAAATYGTYLPITLRGFQPAPVPSPTGTQPLPTSTPVTPAPTPGNTPTPTSTPTDTSGWVTLVMEDFEGSFPGSWTVFDNNPGSGEYYWADRTCRPFAGSYSGWAVGGGVDGGTLSCGSFYPNNADSWLVYGPFSLADATDAELLFKSWIYSETSYDFFYWMASTNGINFSGNGFSGDSGGWTDLTLDLKNVPGLGDLTGEPAVWVALIFQSDGSLVLSEGAYVDDILLRKCTIGGCVQAVGRHNHSLITFPAQKSIHIP